jgi:nitrilase
MLVCWENYMPLARYALYAWGAELHLAPTWDRGESWLSTLRHIAKEGRMHVIGVTPFLRGSDIGDSVPGLDGIYGGDDDVMSQGNTTIVGPEGEILAGPLTGEEGILYAELDLAAARASRRQFDVAGHYARPDVFRLVVDTRSKPAVTFETELPDEP